LELVAQNSASWNRLTSWLKQLDALSRFVESANHLLSVSARAMNCQPEADCECHTPDDGWSEVRGAQVADGWVNANRGAKSDDSGDRQRLS
jgi:hypothetical protein